MWLRVWKVGDEARGGERARGRVRAVSVCEVWKRVCFFGACEACGVDTCIETGVPSTSISWKRKSAPVVVAVVVRKVRGVAEQAACHRVHTNGRLVLRGEVPVHKAVEQTRLADPVCSEVVGSA